MTQATSRKSLGRGLSALLGENSTSNYGVSTTNCIMVSPHNIRPGKYQPRKIFDEEKLQLLIQSIREKGIIQPLVVRALEDEQTYELIAGERRWRAAKVLGIESVPVVIRISTDADALETAIIENVQRDDLTAIEEAEGYFRLIEEFSYTQEQLANVIGKSRSHIANTLRLRNLPDIVKEMIQNKEISAGHARALITADDPVVLAKKISEEGLNVRQAEELSKASSFKPHSLSESHEQISLLEEQIAALLQQKVNLKLGKAGIALTILFKNYEEIDEFLAKIREMKLLIHGDACV